MVVTGESEQEDEPAAKDETSDEGELDSQKSIGELAGLPVAEVEETIEVDNEKPETTDKAGHKKASKKLKIPNFERFRTRLFLGIGGFILLIVLWIFAFVVMPKAKIIVKTDTSAESASLSFTVDTAATNVDSANLIVPGVLKQAQKTDSQTAGATGQKDLGTKASGTATVSNCGPDPVSVPAGTGISSGGLTFISPAEVPAKLAEHMLGTLMS